MEEGKGSGAHSLHLQERKKGMITGVREVFSFDDKEILLDTSAGAMTIRGMELSITRLYIEQGEIDIAGQIDSIVYSKSSEQKKNKGKRILGRMFQ